MPEPFNPLFKCKFLKIFIWETGPVIWGDSGSLYGKNWFWLTAFGDFATVVATFKDGLPHPTFVDELLFNKAYFILLTVAVKEDTDWEF